MRNVTGVKVCFVAGTLEHGGAERQLFYMLQALCRAGVNVRLLSMDRGEFWESRIRGLGVSVTCVGDRPSRVARLVRVLKELWKDPPDVLQSQHFFTNGYVGVAARFLQVAGIGAMRNDGRSEVEENGALGGRLNLHLPQLIAANSQMAMRYAMRRGIAASRLYFLPNVIDTEWFKPANSPSEKPLTLVAVGRLVKQKRLDRFITILHRLRTDFGLKVKGLIVGPGCQNENLRLELEEQARSLGLDGNAVQFLGGVSDIRPVYHEGAVCVLTSDFEGTPNALLEAMACGLPVVATNVGGVPEIVRHGRTGFLHAPNDVEGLVGSVAALLKNRELRTEIGRRGRWFVEQNHSLERLLAYLSGLYEVALPSPSLSAPPAIQGTSI